jgi:hypothetical protein
MKKVKSFLWMFVVAIFLCSCNSGSQKNMAKQKDEPKSDNQMQIITKNNEPTKEQLYSIAETKLANYAKVKIDSSVSIKQLKVTIDDTVHDVSCYFSKNRLISVENRIINTDGKDKSFIMFHFEGDNRCFASYRKKNENDTPLFYIFENGAIIEHNYLSSRLLVDSLEKSKLIIETQKVLELNMQYFPEFKYTFNWK